MGRLAPSLEVSVEDRQMRRLEDHAPGLMTYSNGVHSDTHIVIPL
jgi:hypothetical protein